MTDERWHVTSYADAGEWISHRVYLDYDAAKYRMIREGLRAGTNVLVRASQCACKGKLT